MSGNNLKKTQQHGLALKNAIYLDRQVWCIPLKAFYVYRYRFFEVFS